jgi:hypothetical protein
MIGMSADAFLCGSVRTAGIPVPEKESGVPLTETSRKIGRRPGGFCAEAHTLQETAPARSSAQVEVRFLTNGQIDNHCHHGSEKHVGVDPYALFPQARPEA